MQVVGIPNSPYKSGGVVDSKVIDDNAGQPSKAYSPILVTLLGIVIDNIALQY